MAEAIKIKAKTRASKGTSNVRRMRLGGAIPAVVYGVQPAAEMLEIDGHALETILRHHRGEHILMDLEIEGSRACKVLLKDVQHHAITDAALHVDFFEVSMTQKIRVEIPVELTGIPAGVSQQSGILNHLVRAIQISCLPGDIPEKVDMDVSALNIGQHLSVADIKLDPAKYQILTDATLAIAIVAAPRAEEEVKPAEAAAEGAAAGAEPEVLREKKEEGEAEGAAKDPAKGAAKDPAKEEKKGEKKPEKKEKK